MDPNNPTDPNTPDPKNPSDPETPNPNDPAPSGGEPPAWMQDEEIKGFFERNRFGEGDEGLIKALKAGVSAERKLGVPADRLMTIPEAGPDADPDAWKTVRAKMGVPEKADAYAFEPVALGEGEDATKIEISDDQKAILQAGALKLGLTPAQAQGVVAEMYAPLYGQALEAQKQAASEADQRAEAAREALKKEWGAAFDDKFAAAEEAAESLGEDFIKEIGQNGLINSPHLVKLLADYAEARREPSQLPGARGARPSGGKRTPAEMQADLRAFDAKHEKALHDKGDPQHKWAVEERLRIIKSSQA